MWVPTTGVRAYYINGVYNSVVVACVWCEIEGMMGVVSANNLSSSLSSSLSLSPLSLLLSSMWVWAHDGIAILVWDGRWRV